MAAVAVADKSVLDADTKAKLAKAKEDGKELQDKETKRKLKELEDYLSSSASAEQKIQFAAEKFKQQLHDSLRVERDMLLARLHSETLVQERDHHIREYGKLNVLREKLEALCRELQKQNKLIVEDSKRSALEEQTKRKELAEKFHGTIQEVSAKLEEQGEERIKQFKENDILREKLTYFAEQYEVREQQYTSQLKYHTLENQLIDAKFKQQIEINNQKTAELTLLKEELERQKEQEVGLKSQLSMFSEKFEQFSETMTKSNEVFTSFKKEIEKLGNLNKKLEKENDSLKRKSDKCDLALLEITEEKNKAVAQCNKLQSLCRTLQAERKALAAANASVAAASASAAPVNALPAEPASEEQEAPAS